MSTSQVASLLNKSRTPPLGGKFKKWGGTDRDKHNPDVTAKRTPMEHPFPHTHAQTNHGAPAVHRDKASVQVQYIRLKLTRKFRNSAEIGILQSVVLVKICSFLNFQTSVGCSTPCGNHCTIFNVVHVHSQLLQGSEKELGFISISFSVLNWIK